MRGELDVLADILSGMDLGLHMVDHRDGNMRLGIPVEQSVLQVKDFRRKLVNVLIHHVHRVGEDHRHPNTPRFV